MTRASLAITVYFELERARAAVRVLEQQLSRVIDTLEDEDWGIYNECTQ